MIYLVSASYLYAEDPARPLGSRCELSLNIIYECGSDRAAIIAGIKWGINRGQANEFGSPVCIKVHPYQIGKPEPNGYIKTGIFGMGTLLEWKYDTSPWSIEQLLAHYQTKEG